MVPRKHLLLTISRPYGDALRSVPSYWSQTTLYSFRLTGAIDIYHRTDSIEKLKAAMGHSNIMVSLTYLRGLDVVQLKEEDMPMI